VSWSSFSGDQVEALAQAAGLPEQPRERECPACGERAVRAYLSAPPAARRPTLVSYVWCAACRRFVGTRTARPDGLVFDDPVADWPAPERPTLVDFLDHLDRLWDDGVLPQRFS
jgi:hypothetical protein